MTAKHKIADKLLILLEKRLKQADLWQAAKPDPQALASQEPFCVDTLTYPEWLEFVFIPRMQELIKTAAPLPQQCALTPQAEMQLSNEKQASIGEVTQAIDNLLTEGKTPPASLLKQADS